MGALKTIALYFFVAVALTVFGGWLFKTDKAANPGPLSSAHEEAADCEDCHKPWKGVTDDMCLECHDFSDPSELKPELQFHEAGRFCTKCHFEHMGRGISISKVDHTLFNGKLLCKQCHLDPHKGLFGINCRQCHGIKTWKVEGFRHPRDEERECYRCHRPPQSHLDERFWAEILEGHTLSQGEEIQHIQVKECWRCHITHRWAHLRMEHLFD